jgi:hypothetical protein
MAGIREEGSQSARDFSSTDTYYPPVRAAQVRGSARIRFCRQIDGRWQTGIVSGNQKQLGCKRRDGERDDQGVSQGA